LAICAAALLVLLLNCARSKLSSAALRVLADAALLVPALVSLFGSWNWWMPERPARLLRIRPSRASGEKPAIATSR